MHVDIDGGVRVVTLAAGFEWSWTKKDVKSFCKLVSWNIQSRDEYGAVLRTTLGVDPSVANVTYDRAFLKRHGKSHQQMLQVSVYVTDLLDPDMPDLDVFLVDKFAELSALIEIELGEPTRRSPGYQPEIAWYLPHAAIVLAVGSRFIQIDVVNPTYQEWWDRQDDEDDDLDEFIEPEESVGDEVENGLHGGPLEWNDYISALAATLWLMPDDGRLELATANGIVRFALIDYHLSCEVVFNEISTATIVQDAQTIFSSNIWDASKNGGVMSWKYKLNWPSVFEKYELAAAEVVEIINKAYHVDQTSEIVVEAWNPTGDAPDISRLGAVEYFD
ncbi:MAG: hypothetical protein JWN03_4839 [Nocardia sp.]|uniref:DUF6301 family protein n=1 Tax=Nocardia sp. TaxID=1821 RepID=UPI00262649AB|nr:DUF6301 family protein [Nocardia sp.]MCU1644564.1 hypothetical protein [Nocardia sp.]